MKQVNKSYWQNLSPAERSAIGQRSAAARKRNAEMRAKGMTTETSTKKKVGRPAKYKTSNATPSYPTKRKYTKRTTTTTNNFTLSEMKQTFQEGLNAIATLEKMMGSDIL